MIPSLLLTDWTHGTPGDRARMLTALTDSSLEFGGVKLRKHGIDRELVDINLSQARRFFVETPGEQKLALRWLAGGRQRGYGEFSSEHAAGTDAATAFDLKEYYSFGPKLSLGHPYANRYGKNIYPAHLPEWRAPQEALYQQQQRAVQAVLGMYSILIGMPEDFLPSRAAHGDSLQRFLSYLSMRKCREAYGGPLPPGCKWSREHFDINLLTLLLTGSGLVIKTKHGEVRPEVQPDEVFIQTGNTLEDRSGGYFPATKHWVENPEDEDASRGALAFFAHEHWDSVIETVEPMKPHATIEVKPETEQRKIALRLTAIGHTVPIPEF